MPTLNPIDHPPGTVCRVTLIPTAPITDSCVVTVGGWTNMDSVLLFALANRLLGSITGSSVYVVEVIYHP